MIDRSSRGTSHGVPLYGGPGLAKGAPRMVMEFHDCLLSVLTPRRRVDCSIAAVIPARPVTMCGEIHALWSLRSYNKIVVLEHVRILNAADAQRVRQRQMISCGKDAVWRSIAKPPKTCWPTCTVSQQRDVPDCNDSGNHLQEFSRAASGNGVRH